MACRAAVDRGSPTAQILGDVGRDVALAQFFDKVASVVTLVCPQSDPPARDRDAVSVLDACRAAGLTLVIADGRISRIYAVRNPQKLGRLGEEALLSR